MPMLIGTSGWQYRDWRGGLYPEGVPLWRTATWGYLRFHEGTAQLRAAGAGVLAGTADRDLAG
jgi:uncharacterized protein YecE (DUF72 family)